MLVWVMLALVLLWLIFIQYLIWYFNNDMHCIISIKKIFIYKKNSLYSLALYTFLAHFFLQNKTKVMLAFQTIIDECKCQHCYWLESTKLIALINLAAKNISHLQNRSMTFSFVWIIYFTTVIQFQSFQFLYRNGSTVWISRRNRKKMWRTLFVLFHWQRCREVSRLKWCSGKGIWCYERNLRGNYVINEGNVYIEILLFHFLVEKGFY